MATSWSPGGWQAWDLPSGVLRVGEDVCTGVRRVVSDTVTIGVTMGWLAGIHTHIRDGMTLVFLARHATGRATARGDVQQCRWVTPDVAFRMLWPRRAEQLRGVLHFRHVRKCHEPLGGHHQAVLGLCVTDTSEWADPQISRLSPDRSG
jgi:predicted NUDIX family NTP pyrophosphohydrolase